MDYSVFGRKNVITRNRDDRFVLSRDYISEIRGRSWNNDSSSDLFSLSCSIGENLKRTRYADYLDRALGVAKAPGTQPERLWPCIPRRKGYLSTADNILDLPTYSSAIFPELLDWSKDNVLVAALGTRYHKWSCSDQQIVSRMHTLYEIMCCKFDPRGELLLLGTHMRRVEIHNNARNKRENVVYCHGPLSVDRREMHFYCSVTAVDWSPTGNSFVMYLLRVSPDLRFVAVAAVNSTAVLLLTWPALKSHCTINADWMIKTITWHPWRSALLGVGAVTAELQACVATLHAPTGAVRARPLAPRNYSLDAMLFSERSGELVVSLWSTERVSHPPVYSQLVVLSDPDTVVDQWGDGRSWPDRVRTMVFSPDGTKLATATIKEDLIIWNFLPEDKVQKKTRRKQFYAMPMYQDLATLGVSIR